MTDVAATPHAEDVLSVGTRISWGAIVGGGLVAFAIYFALTLLGAAVGLSVSESVKASSLNTAMVAWTILTLSTALFVGGLVTSLFTVGENKVEAVFYGVIMWAFLMAVVLAFGAAGVRGGFGSLVRLTHGDPASVTWEANAREAGVPPQVIADWRAKSGASSTSTDDAQKRAELLETATRVAWYAFAGAWISMLAAAAGAWMGAGPTFRVVAVIGQRRSVSPF